MLLLEGTRDGGRKILISGGGRCNVLPAALEPARFVTDSSPNTMRNLLRSWPLDAQRRFFEDEAGVPLTLEAETGKWFPASNRARDVRDASWRWRARAASSCASRPASRTWRRCTAAGISLSTTGNW